MVLLLERTVLFSLMISTCPRKKCMELNLQLNFFVNGWIMAVGTILTQMKKNSEL